MSEISEKPSLLMSTGQALVPQWMSGAVPAEFSTVVLKPSQSGSLAGMIQGGRFWLRFGQFGQLSLASGTVSQSRSPGQGRQVLPKKPPIFVISVMSTEPSTGSVEMALGAGAIGAGPADLP